MSTDSQSLEMLAAIEQALVRHQPFGNSAYILEQLNIVSKRRLERVAPQLPIAGQLIEAFDRADAYTRYRIVGNTVIRCAVQHAHTRLESGVDYGLPLSECEKVFEATLCHLEAGKSGTPFENGAISLHRLGQQEYHGWIWREDYPHEHSAVISEVF